MRYDDLRRVFARLGIQDLPQPNHSGWTHVACPYAPWKHKNGVDKSHGFAIKVDDANPSAFTCPACKSKGRIPALIRDMAALRGEDYSDLLREVIQIETSGAMFAPAWEDRHKLRKDLTETLPPPISKVVFNPDEIFDDVRDHAEAVAYLKSRRISYAGVVKAGIRYDPDKRRLVFPVYDADQNLYGFTGRTVLPKERLQYTRPDGSHVTIPKVLDYANLPKRLLILGEHRWTRARSTIIVEGLFAYARFLTEGVDEHFNVGALLGSEATPGKLAILRRWGCPVYAILDPDAAGDAGIFGKMREVGKDRYTGEPILQRDHESGLLWGLIDHVPVYVPAYPEGYDDPDALTLAQVLGMCAACPPCVKPSLGKLNRTPN